MCGDDEFEESPEEVFLAESTREAVSLLRAFKEAPVHAEIRTLLSIKPKFSL